MEQFVASQVKKTKEGKREGRGRMVTKVGKREEQTRRKSRKRRHVWTWRAAYERERRSN